MLAIAPELVDTTLIPSTSVTRGITIGVGVLVICCVFTNCYIRRANSELYCLNKEGLDDAQES